MTISSTGGAGGAREEHLSPRPDAGHNDYVGSGKKQEEDEETSKASFPSIHSEPAGRGKGARPPLVPAHLPESFFVHNGKPHFLEQSDTFASTREGITPEAEATLPTDAMKHGETKLFSLGEVAFAEICPATRSLACARRDWTMVYAR